MIGTVLSFVGSGRVLAFLLEHSIVVIFNATLFHGFVLGSSVNRTDWSVRGKLAFLGASKFVCTY